VNIGTLTQGADGADVVDQLTEILLPGRTIGSLTGDAGDRTVGGVLPSFVAGPENRLVAAAVGALLQVDASEAMQSCATPWLLSLYGPSGSGKTHLVRGLVEYWKEHHGAESAVYLTASDFRRGFADAIENDSVGAFRASVRGRALLAIDDLHQLPDDDFLMQELRHTLDEYEESGDRVVVGSNQPAPALSNLPSDLRSRFAAGLVLQIALPGSAARGRIARQAGAALGFPLGDEVADRLAGGVCGTASELLGAVFDLCARPAGSEKIASLERVLAARAARRATLREIVAAVAKYYRLPQSLLRSATRRQAAVLPRSVIIYLARELAGSTYEQIGRALGGRDHTTVMHSYRKIDRERQHDPAIQATLDELRRRLMGR
jgi:chromosomal replication initiator protein